MSTSSNDRSGGNVAVPWLRGLGRGSPFPWLLVRTIRERIDECRARRLRKSFGPRGDLLSWQPEPGGGWRSRLSGPSLVYTVERVGKTRVEAIQHTLRARERILTLRDAIDFTRMQAAPQNNDF